VEEDEGVVQERNRVKRVGQERNRVKGDAFETDALVLSQLIKIFGRGPGQRKVAVAGISLGVRQGEVKK